MKQKTKKFQEAMQSFEPKLKAAFLESIKDINSEVQLQLILGHIKAGDINSAIAALNLKAEFLRPLEDAMRESYLRGGAEALGLLPKLPDPFRVAVWRFALTAEILALRLG